MHWGAVTFCGMPRPAPAAKPSTTLQTGKPLGSPQTGPIVVAPIEFRVPTNGKPEFNSFWISATVMSMPKNQPFG